MLGRVVTRRVEAKAIVAEPNRLGTAHFWLAYHDLDVKAGPLLGGPPRRGDDFDGHVRVLSLHVCGGRGGDVGREAVGGRYPHDAFEGALPAGVDGQGTHGRFDGFGGRQRVAAQIGELPTTADPRQHPTADRLLQRGDSTRDGGVVEP